MILKSEIFQNLLLIIFLFGGIFTPTVCPIPTRFFVIGLAIFIIFVNTLSRKKIYISRNFIWTYIGFVPFLLYFMIVQINRVLTNPKYKEAYISTTKGTVLAFVYTIIIGTALIILIERYRVDRERIFRIFFYVGFIQLIFVLMSFFIAPFRDIIIDAIVKYSREENIVAAIYRHIDKRIYGFASNLFDEFGYSTSILISISFLYGMEKKNKKIIVLSVLMLLIPLLNTRTGLLLSIIGLSLILLCYFRVNRFLNYIITIGLIFVLGLICISYLPDALRDWLILGFDLTIDFITKGNKSTGTFYVLFNEDMIFPPDLLFGAGAKTDYILRSIDNGYMQALWRYGIIGMVLLFIGYIHMFLRCRSKSKDKMAKCLMIVILTILFIYFIKLFPVTMFGANILLFGIPAIMNTQNDVHLFKHQI